MIQAVLLASPVMALSPEAHGHGGEQARGKDAPGQVLRARVVARLPEGDFLVTVGGQAARMSLPAGTRPGDVLRLILVSDYPALTFALATAPTSDGATLSEGGRLAAALASPDHGPVPALSHAAPLTASPEAPLPLAQALQDAIARSGLFYEAHQAQWAAGERPLAELLLEPQAQLAPTPPGDKAVDPRVLSLVQQQLAALDSGQLRWLGQIWPGQSLDWRIEEDPRERRPAPVAPTKWRTSLRLELPRLGALMAELAFEAGGGLHVRLSAASMESAATLDARSSAVERALAAAGLGLRTFRVEHHAAA